MHHNWYIVMHIVYGKVYSLLKLASKRVAVLDDQECEWRHFRSNCHFRIFRGLSGGTLTHPSLSLDWRWQRSLRRRLSEYIQTSLSLRSIHPEIKSLNERNFEHCLEHKLLRLAWFFSVYAYIYMCIHVIYLCPVLSSLPFLKFQKQNFMKFGRKHVETKLNCSYEFITFLKYHMPLRRGLNLSKISETFIVIWTL